MLATLYGFSREDCDRYAVMSQQRAAHAREQGYFKSIVPVKDMNGITILDHDEFIRPETTLDGLAKLKPSFKMFNDFGHGDIARLKYPQLEEITNVHTPGNSSGIVDGASLVLVGNEQAGKDLGLKPRARIVSFALTGSEPTIMLAGPAPAAQKALAKAGLAMEDIDLVELNEAFASVVLRFQQVMNVADDKINVNGGAIAMGHPIGATGGMILGSLLDELERRNLKRGMATLCAGGGIGIATIIERV
jgi:acetyl-CoA C-acetyltransferase